MLRHTAYTLASALATAGRALPRARSGVTSITFVTELRGIAAALAATGDAAPSLALTIDGGASWMAVTGLSGLAALPSPAQAPDLVATGCAPSAHTLCVAAGGYLPSAAGLWPVGAVSMLSSDAGVKWQARRATARGSVHDRPHAATRQHDARSRRLLRRLRRFPLARLAAHLVRCWQWAARQAASSCGRWERPSCLPRR